MATLTSDSGKIPARPGARSLLDQRIHVDISDYWWILRRRKALVVTVFFVLLSLILLYSKTREPVYQSSCEEIYDIQMLADTKRPGIMGLDPRREPVILTPGGGFWGVKVKEEKAEQPATGKSFEEETTELEEE